MFTASEVEISRSIRNFQPSPNHSPSKTASHPAWTELDEVKDQIPQQKEFHLGPQSVCKWLFTFSEIPK